MKHTTVVLITLIAYKIVLIGIGLYARGKNKNETDYYLGGRSLGPWVAALSASASSSSAWTLLGVSGAAYAWGLSAVWLFPACLGGFLINWFLIAPRLRRFSHETGVLTVTQALAGSREKPAYLKISALASAIILFSLLFYIASQFQGSAKTFQSTFGLSPNYSILLGSAIIIFYTMIGGFWAVSLTDALQGLVMALTALLLPAAALLAVGGPGLFWEGLGLVQAPGFSSLIQNMSLPAGLGFILGLFGIGLGYPGQPHVVNRFMALRDEQSVRTGRLIAISWAVIVYAGMILLGLCGRILIPGLEDKETVFIELANALFSPVFAGVMVAAVLSATMSTADSQLLVAASSITSDLNWFRGKDPVFMSRVVVVLLSAGAVIVALFGGSEIFSKVLFAWTAMGAAFGPLLLVRLFRGPIPVAHTLWAMALGFGLSVIAYSFPEFVLQIGGQTYSLPSKGSWMERVVPFVISFGVAWAGARRVIREKH